MNFGPLSKTGGERRLNVAVTRARYQVSLVGSIQPTDIDINRISGEGPKLLRKYIDFAMNGIGAIEDEKAAKEKGRSELSFEKVVFDFLKLKGYKVEREVGCSGYRIDLAVRHPKKNGRFVLGIECDGLAYSLARTARERDRLRQSVLEAMGWKIFRLWSLDWLKNPTAEKERLVREIENAIKEFCPEKPKKVVENDKKEKSIENFLAVSDKPKAAAFRPRHHGFPAADVPLSSFEETILKLLEFSIGIDKESLMIAVSKAYGWERRGSVINARLEQAFQSLKRAKRISEQNGKINML
jgi:very-short-patch-repair endonuclease